MKIKKKQELPWKNEEEFYDLHSKEIFSRFSFYHTAMIGEDKIDFLKYIIKKSKIIQGSRVLDLGCGSGYLVNSLKDFCEIKGISTSKECIKQCKLNYPESNFEVGNMETFTYKNCSHILALESLNYSNIEKTFKKTYKNLKKKGIFYIKDICIFYNQNKKQKINSENWKTYWKYNANSIFEIISIAYKTRFELLEFNDLSEKINSKEYFKTLKYNKVSEIIPYPKIKSGISVEFIFIKK